MFYEKLDLPKLPEDLLLTDPDEIRKLPNTFVGESKNYTIHDVPDELLSYLKNMFPDRTLFRYQTLTDGVPIHIDVGRNDTINYIINTGGDNVITSWYDENGTEQFSVCIPKQTWHWLKVDVPHGVHNIKAIRVAVTVA